MIRAMIVEDDKLARKGIIRFIPWEKYGIQIVGDTYNGVKALELMEHTEVDLLITDLDMPVMNGVQLMREVAVRYPAVKTVVLSIHKEFEYVQEALRLGAIDYIAKLDLEDEQYDSILERIVRQVTGRESAVREAGDILPGQKYSREITSCILEAVEMINRDISCQWYAVDIAKRINISRSYFNQCFKDIIGKTFKEYLRYVRIERSKELLTGTSQTVESIANQVGYSDEKYFASIFRKVTGTLPSRYRSQHKE